MAMLSERTAKGIDYDAFEGAIGLNWHDVDPNLQFQMSRLKASSQVQ